MQVANIPAKFGVVWASSAATTGGPNGDGYVRTPPNTSQIGVHDGYASFPDGFVPLNAQPIASGGVPPYQEDVNGVLKMVTAWDQWVQAGGPVVYDSAFSTAIGGYPTGALLISTANSGITWQSTADANTTNPDGSSPSGWVARPVVASALTALARDANGTGGALTLANSDGYGSLVVDTFQGKLRAFSGSVVGFSYDPGAYVLTVGSGTSGGVSSTTLVITPDGSGNRTLYFARTGGGQSGHILQDNSDGSTSQAGVTTGSGAIHINATGTGPEVVVDTSGGLTATALNVGGGEITDFSGIVGTSGSAASIGSGGISTTGPGSVSSQLNLYGNNLSFYAGTIGQSGGNALTAQMVYNAATPKTSGPQTEIWCENACFWVDSAGGGYLRATSSQPSTFGKITTTAASERALKQDIVPLTDGLAALWAAPPIRFRYNEASGLDTATQHVGNLYEELAEAMPEATLRVGGRGQVDHRNVVPYLHSAVLELAAENASLRARLDALEARIAPVS